MLHIHGRGRWTCQTQQGEVFIICGTSAMLNRHDALQAIVLNPPQMRRVIL